MTREKILEIARSQIGVEEMPRGSNDGEAVRKYLSSVGIESPAPWCAAFVFWVFKRAGVSILPRTGWTPLIYKWAKEKKRIIPAREAKPADLVLFYFPSLKRVGHVGIVGAVTDKYVWTIEGNTNEEGKREGYAVCRKRRRLNDNMIFVRTL